MSKSVPPSADGSPPFERIALLLQGRGALRAYQGGVYQALAEHDLHPDWIAGISIGAISDMSRTLTFREVLQRPTSPDGVFTFDLKHHIAP